jgi:rhamnulose-1-phosphate aldolase
MIQTPYPKIDDLLEMMGEVGLRLSEIEASEGAAGNTSVCARWAIETQSRFPLVESIELTQPVPELAGATFLVSGSGCRLREILDEPDANVGCIVVDEGGRMGKLYTSHRRHFQRATSEFNSHLAVHYDQVLSSGTNFHAVVHAQPLHLTYLSHVPRYRDETYLNTRLLRWQPETALNLPEGIGVVPFCVPGSAELMSHTVESLRGHRIVVWSKHGVMSRSDLSVKQALDRIEYAEAAAKYEYHNLAVGEIADGLSAEEVRSICKTYNVKQNIF